MENRLRIKGGARKTATSAMSAECGCKVVIESLDQSLPDSSSDPRVDGLVAFQEKRKRDNRDRLLAAAMTEFCNRGYLAVPVEDIASRAGVSRMTFYRHFSNKADLAAELFNAAAATAMPRFVRITTMVYRDRDEVLKWIKALFEADYKNRRALRAFAQATVDEDSFTERAQQLISEIIQILGATIPAFAVDPDRPDERRRWLEAWLLIYEILDQGNHAALNSGVATDPLVIEILADRFLQFVRSRPS